MLPPKKDSSSTSTTVLAELGRSIAFELAVGVNGMLWVHSESPAKTILICNAIKVSEVMKNDKQIVAMVKDLLKALKRQELDNMNDAEEEEMDVEE
jgi:exosome complex component RRP40